jgi:imidazolonepropionase-like amidohydrolase
MKLHVIRVAKNNGDNMMRYILAGLFLVFGISANAQAATFVLSAERMFDARSGKMIEKPVILIRDGRIIEVATNGANVSSLDNIERIDLKGMTLLPGLIDMHTHIDSDPTYGGYTGLQFNDRFWSVLSVLHAKKTLILV